MRWLIIIVGMVIVHMIFETGSMSYYIAAFFVVLFGLIGVRQTPHASKQMPSNTSAEQSIEPKRHEAVFAHKEEAVATEKKANKVRLSFIFLGIIATMGVALWLASRKTGERPAGLESVQVQRPAGFDNVWSPDEKERALFPALRTAAMRESSIEAKVYCAYQWDMEKLRNVERVLRENGLLESQWNPAVAGLADPFDDFGSEAGVYFRTVNSAWLLFVDDESSLVHRQGIPEKWKAVVPSAEVRLRARGALDADSPCTVANALPLEIVLRAESPRVTLVTDFVPSISLKQLVNVLRLYSSGAFQDLTKALAREIGCNEMEVPFFNPDLMLTTTQLSLEVNTGVNRRETLRQSAREDAGWSKLRDAVLYFVRSEDLMPEELRHTRDAYYDPTHEWIFAKLDRRRPDDSILSLIPAELFHEFSHYLFGRGITNRVRFLAEGEATAYGERSFQRVMAARQNLRSADPLAFAKLQDPKTSGAERQGLFRSYLDAMNTVGLTSEQQRFLGLLNSNGISGEQIETQLTLPPAAFEGRPDQALAYARGWVIYHLDLLDAETAEMEGAPPPRRRAKKLEGIANKLQPADPGLATDLNPEDRSDLAAIASEASEWISRAITNNAPKRP